MMIPDIASDNIRRSLRSDIRDWNLSFDPSMPTYPTGRRREGGGWMCPSNTNEFQQFSDSSSGVLNPYSANFPPARREVLCVVDEQGLFVALCPNWQSVLGWDSNELNARNLFDYVHSDSQKHLRLEWEKIRASGVDGHFEGMFQHKNGDRVLLRWSLRPCPAQKQLWARVCDVTEVSVLSHVSEVASCQLCSKDFESTKSVNIFQSQETLQLIVKSLPLMFITIGPGRKLEWVNPEWTRILGWSVSELNDKGFLMALFPDPSELAEAEEFFLSESLGWKDFNAKTQDGRSIFTSWSKIRLSDGQTIAIGKDISVRKQREYLIQQQQLKIVHSFRLSSLGEMAGSIAHEINNPLAVILGKASQIRRSLQAEQALDHQDLVKKVVKIEETCERIVKIIRGLKSFSRDAEKDPFILVSYQNLLDDVLELCGERFKSRAVRLNIEGDLTSPIFCRVTQIAQVLLNLLNNSYDAVINLPDPWVTISLESEKDGVRIAVTDAGSGIPQDVVEKIMQPFFSTKERGMGTGLGLSISSAIMEDHNGQLYLDKDQTNTCFVLRLPRNCELD